MRYRNRHGANGLTGAGQAQGFRSGIPVTNGEKRRKKLADAKGLKHNKNEHARYLRTRSDSLILWLNHDKFSKATIKNELDGASEDEKRRGYAMAGDRLLSSLSEPFPDAGTVYALTYFAAHTVSEGDAIPSMREIASEVASISDGMLCFERGHNGLVVVEPKRNNSPSAMDELREAFKGHGIGIADRDAEEQIAAGRVGHTVAGAGSWASYEFPRGLRWCGRAVKCGIGLNTNGDLVRAAYLGAEWALNHSVADARRQYPEWFA